MWSSYYILCLCEPEDTIRPSLSILGPTSTFPRPSSYRCYAHPRALSLTLYYTSRVSVCSSSCINACTRVSRIIIQSTLLYPRSLPSDFLLIRALAPAISRSRSRFRCSLTHRSREPDIGVSDLDLDSTGLGSTLSTTSPRVKPIARPSL